MKAIILIIAAISISGSLFAQGKRVPASAGRLEFIEVEKNVKLHVTDIGEGQPIVLIHGWPLSDAMFEYQYHALAQKGIPGDRHYPARFWEIGQALW